MRKWYKARAYWISNNVATFQASDVTYAVLGESLRALAHAAAGMAIVAVVVLAVVGARINAAERRLTREQATEEKAFRMSNPMLPAGSV